MTTKVTPFAYTLILINTPLIGLVYLILFGEKALFLLFLRFHIAELDSGMIRLQQLQNLFHILFFVEDQIGKFLLPVDKDQPVVVIGGAVVRLALADPAEAALDVVIGNVIFDPQIPVIQAQLAQTDTPDLFSGLIVFNMRLVADPFFVNTFEFQLSEHSCAPLFLGFIRSASK